MKSFGTIILAFLMLGSTGIAQWVQTNGPEGGAVFELLADVSNLYAGTSGAGVFLSTDAGATWTQKINGMGYQTVVAMAKSGCKWSGFRAGQATQNATPFAVEGYSVWEGEYRLP